MDRPRAAHKNPIRPVSVLLFLGLLLGTSLGLAEGAAGGEPKLPPFSQITQVATQAVAKNNEDFQTGDLIVRSQARAVLEQVRKLGWRPADWEEILEAVPADGDYVAKQLRSRAGTKAMREISRMPLGYDRLFRMGGLENGQRLVYDVCHGAGGYKLIQYMTESSGGKTLGQMTSRAPRGADFNAPTGQIYTLPALLKRLRESYDRDRQPASR